MSISLGGIKAKIQEFNEFKKPQERCFAAPERVQITIEYALNSAPEKTMVKSWVSPQISHLQEMSRPFSPGGLRIKYEDGQEIIFPWHNVVYAKQDFEKVTEE